MKSISTNIYLALVLFIIIPTKSFSTVYSTKAAGSFTSASTWNIMPPMPPAQIGPNDTILINNNDTIPTNINYTLNGTMIIKTGVTFYSSNAVFQINNNSHLIVNGTMKMLKYNNNGTFTVNGRVEAQNSIINNSSTLGMNGNGGIIRVGVSVVNNSGGAIGGYINFCRFDEVTNPMQVITGTIDYNTVTICGGTLPIVLTKFDAASENYGVRVEWILGVNNSSSFDLEKSYDGNNFNKVATIDTTIDNNYSYLDKNENNPLIYYRLKTYNSSGIGETSNIISVIQTLNKVEIYPNPCSKNDKMSIKINSSNNGNCDVMITNSQGNVIYNNQFLANEIILPEFSLNPGIYFIQISSDSERLSEKFIIE